MDSSHRTASEFGDLTPQSDRREYVPQPGLPLWRKWAEIVALALGIIGLLSITAKALGIRVDGTAQDVVLLKAHELKQDTRLDALERNEGVWGEQLRFLNYQQCVQQSNGDKLAAQGCAKIIQDYRLSQGAP